MVVTNVIFSNAMFSGLIDPLSTSDLTFHSKSGVVAARFRLNAGFFVVVVGVVVDVVVVGTVVEVVVFGVVEVVEVLKEKPKINVSN